MKPDQFSPFSNGSEYRYWKERNCERCTKDYDSKTGKSHCPLEEAIAQAAAGDGTIPRAIADRIGVVAESYAHLGACKELEPADEA